MKLSTEYDCCDAYPDHNRTIDLVGDNFKNLNMQKYAPGDVIKATVTFAVTKRSAYQGSHSACLLAEEIEFKKGKLSDADLAKLYPED